MGTMTKRDQALAEYVAAKAALKAQWEQASQLKGEAYTKAVGKYCRDKATLRKQWEAFKAEFGG
jgi:hypothetical protein